MRELTLTEMHVVAGRKAEEGTTATAGITHYTGEEFGRDLGRVTGSAALGLLGAAGGAHIAGPVGAAVGLVVGRTAGKFAGSICGAATGSYLSKKPNQNNAHMVGTDDAGDENQEVCPVY